MISHKTNMDNEVFMEQLKVIQLNDSHRSITILDQTKLPNHEEYITLSSPQQMWDAIKLLQVRGAPAIGVFAAYAIAVLAQSIDTNDYDIFQQKFIKQADYLNSSRPTAVNLSWALSRMKDHVQTHKIDIPTLKEELIKEAIKIDSENESMTQKIGEYGISLLHEGDGILTHCNAGYLACLGIGTATAPMYKALQEGMHIHVYSDETRPLLQGGRLTSYELYKAGIDVTSICDDMASIVMSQGKIQCVMVGSDRIASNGDFANKIGTSGVAILAKYYNIPFYTLAPSSTIDFNIKSGKDIPIEERDEDEIGSMWYKEPMILKDIKKYNPAFDVTDHSLLTAIITEKGIVYPPFDINLKKLFQEKL